MVRRYFAKQVFTITNENLMFCVTVMYEEYFAVQREIAFNLWNVIVNIGTFIQFFISVYLCVYQKIYIQITVICLAMLLYGKCYCRFQPL